MNKKVSIIIPIYNTEKYLEECLDSVINQTYKNLEIILINDGSLDNSLKICREYETKDGRIVVIDKENSGVSNTRNIGIESSTGDFITFVDSDDWLELDAIETMVNCINKRNVDVVRTNFAINNEVGKIPKKLEGKIETKDYLIGLYAHLNITNNINKLLYYFLNAEIPAYMCLFLIKREIIIDHNLKLNEDLVMMEDTLFFVNLIQYVNSIYILNKKTYNYRIYQESSSNSIKRVEKNIKSVLKVNEEINKIISSDLVEITNRTEFRIISDFIIKMYEYNYESKMDVLNYLKEDTNFNRMINSIKYRYLNKYSKMIYKVFKKKRLNNMDKVYKKIKLHKKLDDIKGIIDYKVNRIYNKYIKR